MQGSAGTRTTARHRSQEQEGPQEKEDGAPPNIGDRTGALFGPIPSTQQVWLIYNEIHL